MSFVCAYCTAKGKETRHPPHVLCSYAPKNTISPFVCVNCTAKGKETRHPQHVSCSYAQRQKIPVGIPVQQPSMRAPTGISVQQAPVQKMRCEACDCTVFNPAFWVKEEDLCISCKRACDGNSIQAKAYAFEVHNAAAQMAVAECDEPYYTPVCDSDSDEDDI